MSDCSTAVEYCDNKDFIFKTDDVDSLKQKIVQYEKKYIKIKCDYQKILEKFTLNRYKKRLLNYYNKL